MNVLSNTWSVGDGVNLWVKPTTGDFSLVTVIDNATLLENVYNTWAGVDRGVSATGFTNNGALGRLILDGANNSAFTFTDLQDGDGITNALYVDVLVLSGSATNLDGAGNLANIFVTPEMKLYYSHVFFDNTDVTVGLNGKSVGGGGGFAAVFHQGVINTATDVSKSGGGTLSQIDLGLNVQITDGLAVISWNTVAGANNNVYYKSAATGGNWVLLTSFESTASGPTSITDPVGPDMRVYKVSVDLPTL